MVEVLGVLAEVDLDPVHLAAEPAAVLRVVVGDRRAGLEADVARLVRGEQEGFGSLDAPFADRGAQLPPTRMQVSLTSMEANYQLNAASLPCDASGNPTR